MKREFLEGLDIGGGAKLSKEAIEAIMAEHGKSKTRAESQISALTTERDTLKSQLDEANKSLQSFKDMDVDGIKAKVDEWEKKYTTDTQSLKDQLADAQYGFSVKEAVAGLKFTSEGAKKAFVADLTAKKLPLQEGKLLGLDDFVKGYKENDPGAFAAEDGGKTPQITRGTSGGDGALSTSDDALRAAFGLPDTNKKE